MNQQKAQQERLLRRRTRIRARVIGSAARPRLSVFRASKHIYAALIDDTVGKTIVAASDRTKVAASKTTKTVRAHDIGTALAKAAKEKGISAVVFDRGGFKYQGTVKAFALAARAAGLEF